MLGHLPHAPSDGRLGLFLADLSSKLSLPNLGVATFYSLSSFLLTYLALEERQRTGGFAITPFLLRRMLRIWPLYFISIGVGVLVYGLAWLQSEAGWVLPFLSNWSLALVGVGGHISHQPSPITLLWSISVEEQFYLVFPVLIYALINSSTRKVLIAIVATFIAGYIFRTIFCIASGGAAPAPGSGGIYFTTFAYLDTFTAGSCAAIVFFNRDRNKTCQMICGALNKATPITLILLIALGSLWAANLWAPYRVMTVLSFGLVGIGAALFVLSVALAERSYIAKFLNTRPVHFLGTVSFSFYVWHLYPARLSEMISNDFNLKLAITLSLSIAFAAASYRLIERPLGKRRKPVSSDNVAPSMPSSRGAPLT